MPPEEIRIGDRDIPLKNLRALTCPGCEKPVSLVSADPEDKLDAYVSHVAGCAGLRGPWSVGDGAIEAKGSGYTLTEEELQPLTGPEVVLERSLEEIRDHLAAEGNRVEIDEEQELVEVEVMGGRDRYLVDKRGGVTLGDDQGAVVDYELNRDMVVEDLKELFRDTWG